MADFTYKDFQRTSVDYAIKNKYCILALEQGLGKSLVSLGVADETNSKTLIICPSYLKLKWAKEVRKFFPHRIVSIFNNAKEFYFPWDSDVVIISYSFVDKAEMLFEWADLVVSDEANYLKSMTAKRTEAFHKLVYENSVDRLLLLTGTPILNRTHEFYSLIALCNYDPRIGKSEFLEKYESYVDFANQFSYLEEFEMYRGNKRVKVQKWRGHKNVDELKKYLKDIYIRFESDKVLGLPPYLEIDVPVKYDDNPELLEAFERFTIEADEDLRVTGVDSRVKAQAALATAPYTAEYAQGIIDSGEQVVIYTDHVDACHAIAKKLGVQGITGAMDMDLRQRLADEFMAGKSRVIVATINSFSTGIDLYSACNMIFNDPSFVPGLMAQAMFRIRRLGQTRKCIFHYISGSIQAEKIWDILKDKIKTIKAVV